MTRLVRPVAERDMAAVVAMNEADVARLSPLTMDSLDRLARLASYFRVVELDGRVAGFLLALASSTAYEGANFLWFKERYAGFLYVDRVVVAADARRAGIASELYEDLEIEAAARGVGRITCEINQRPPNPESHAFHERHGFAEVGIRELDAGKKTLSMRLKVLSVRVPDGSTTPGA